MHVRTEAGDPDLGSRLSQRETFISSFTFMKVQTTTLDVQISDHDHTSTANAMNMIEAIYRECHTKSLPRQRWILNAPPRRNTGALFGQQRREKHSGPKVVRPRPWLGLPGHRTL